MKNIWSRLIRGDSAVEERLSVQDWVNMFTFNGNSYPITYSSPVSGNKRESIEENFTGYINSIYKSSGIAFAAMQARLLIFTEAGFQYQKINEGRGGDLFDSDDLAVLKNPWPNGTTSELLARAIQDTDLAGNHYVVVEGVGPNKRLRRLRPDWVDILLSAPPDTAVQSDVVGYMYYPGGNRKKAGTLYPVDGSNGAVAHWSPIPDPDAQYRGMSWLTPVLREIMSDKAAQQHKQKFFENAATPNLAVSLKETVTQEQFKGFMQQINEAHAGADNAYKTLYLGGGADVTVIGANMQQMDFKTIQSQNESRIAAAARVHPMMIGFSESSTRGAIINSDNLKASKDLFGSGTMRPLWRSLCGAYSSLVPQYSNARLWYDDRDIAFLRQDRLDVAELQSKQATTMSTLIMNGFTPDSVKMAVLHEDWTLLEHTGLYSVQLIPPGSGDSNTPNAGPANEPDADDSKTPAPPNDTKGVGK